MSVPRLISRRRLLGLGLSLPLLAACGEAPHEPTPERVYFQAPTPAPTVATTPTAGTAVTGSRTPRATSTAGLQAAATRSPANHAPTASPAPSRPPLTLPSDPGQRASAQLFPIAGPRATPIPARRPAPTSLIIPAIGLNARIVSIGTRLDERGNLIWETAAFAVGHHQGSANPGQPGNVVLSGHISSQREGNIFANLPKVQLGDGIILRTPERDHLYAVDQIQTVLPSEVHVLEPTGEERAILITCVPDRVYTHRLIVSAIRV